MPRPETGWRGGRVDFLDSMGLGFRNRFERVSTLFSLSLIVEFVEYRKAHKIGRDWNELRSHADIWIVIT